MNSLYVWREFGGTVELVGSIVSLEGELRFEYDASYTGNAISVSLPKTDSPASARTTACFFSALIPEGEAKRELAHMLHASDDEFSSFLERLNNESIGALLFSSGGERPYQDPHYKKIETGYFDELSSRPLETAVATMGMTRLSLSGGMAKVGLYFDEKTGDWFYPLGGAPSTHILKAADGKRFPLETINEALCLGVAARCGFPTADCVLIAAEQGEPILAVRRFDRVFDDAPRMIDGLPAPKRLHQEDFSQASCIALKYEPTDGRYLQVVTSTARDNCANAYGEANLVAEYVMFDYLIGNCDNHLKNYALLYDCAWHMCEVAPLYDVSSTVMYPSIYLEMGVSFGASRHIDDVNGKLMYDSLAACGIPRKIAAANFAEIADSLPKAIEAEAERLSQQGFKQVENLVPPLLEGFERRRKACEL